MKYKKWWLIFSFILIVPGLISFSVYGLRLSIDFTGGSLMEVSGSDDVELVKKTISAKEVEVLSALKSDENKVMVRMKNITEEKHVEIKKTIEEQKLSEIRFENVGPSISKDITRKAFLSIGISILAIVIYISYAFRGIPKPASSFRFAISTIFALVHDVLLLIGVFSLLGRFAGIEIDSLFVTAAMTVVGFSVHDTIVVFDRIRENLKRHGGESFENVVDLSLTETIGRSINTSFTVILVLSALVLFGGSSIRNFILALLIGFVSGTYSSIFNATPILVYWQNFSERRGSR